MEKKFDVYTKFIQQDLSLNDQLAASRSILANERTFLSYQRTALTLIVAGFSFIKFFDTFWIVIIGWLFVPCALLTFFIGIYRYIRMRNLILSIEKKTLMRKIESETINSVIS